MEGDDRWFYYGDDEVTGRPAGIYLVQFKGGRVRYFAYAGDLEEIHGISIGTPIGVVEGLLGKPSRVDYTTDKLTQMYSYNDLNAMFTFFNGPVETLGVFDPGSGPMKFADE
ncbi:hypothetical protein QO002_001117 [Pararhizobium capsulatum DSM 1112]|uniref:Uncharacterized protein n=1 Tax=Pararhizobium capsulatum DSM 1112 TaxID=1121113 RepID=A0ABU0BL64_9HYPH|nr:hypothetical protein [Pararhizobium capsulatum]MDQ0318979.1 hypothetical protein [Pararhizobium capsulatum DSM 1112]